MKAEAPQHNLDYRNYNHKMHDHFDSQCLKRKRDQINIIEKYRDR